MKKGSYIEMLGGKKQVACITIVFIICVIVSIFCQINKDLKISGILVQIAFWGYILNAVYIVRKVVSYNKSQK